MSAFTDADTQRLERMVKEAEGFRLTAYRCTAGALTIGYGHNCDASPVDGVARVGDSITREEAERLFRTDLTNAVWQVRKALPWVTKLSPPRQAVLYDMAYNMGLGVHGVSGLLSFRNTLIFIESGHYSTAAKGMLASRWAVQVKGRAKKLACQMDTGEWQ
ncbi:MAG: glycoside hydrolase family protein [Desulfovibrionaceae bacterium]|nr:glycoside hydrolase family protein [Desulfovibrionaceae bacterium]